MTAPKRGYSWPPFERGHTLSLRHGADSDRTIDARASLVHEELLEVAHWLAEPEFAPAIKRYLRVEARALLLDEYIGKVESERGAGEVPSRLWEQANSTDRLAAALGNVLGLDPVGRARLHTLVATSIHAGASIEDLIAEGRRVIDAREAADGPASAQEPLEALETTTTSETEDDQ